MIQYQLAIDLEPPRLGVIESECFWLQNVRSDCFLMGAKKRFSAIKKLFSKIYVTFLKYKDPHLFPWSCTDNRSVRYSMATHPTRFNPYDSTLVLETTFWTIARDSGSTWTKLSVRARRGHPPSCSQTRNATVTLFPTSTRARIARRTNMVSMDSPN